MGLPNRVRSSERRVSLREPEAGVAGPVGVCPVCGGRPRWESVLDEGEERWLAACRCGRMRTFLPERPDLEPEDPLRAFLLGPGRPVFPAAPPWIRLFLASVEGPNPVRWRYCHGACEGCGACAGFGMQACPRPGTLALCALCLACGNATVEYSKPARGLVEAPIAGRGWAPPCPAVQRLRDCLHRPYSLLRVDGWWVAARDRSGEGA